MGDRLRSFWTRLSGRLILLYAVLAVIPVAVLGFTVRSSVQDALVEQLAANLGREAAALEAALPGSGDLQEFIDRQAEILDARITVINLSGVVVADSEEIAERMENHGDRPEVLEAIGGEVGIDRRVSATLGDARMYVAAPPVDGPVVRLSVTERQLESLTADATRTVALSLVAVFVLGVGLVGLVARVISLPIRDLTEVAGRVAAGRLEIETVRSPIREVDQLGGSIGRMAEELGRRIEESERGRETLSAVLSALPQGVILIEADGSVTYTNPAARAEVGESVTSITHLAPRTLRHVALDAREHGQATAEFANATLLRQYEASAIRFGERRILVVFDDVTDRRRLDDVRSSFVADASHELKTPIASILSSAEALELAVERSPARAPEFTMRIREAAERLARIVTDLLDLSRLEGATQGTARVRLDQIVQDEVEQVKQGAQASGVEVSCELEAVTVTGGAADLALAIRNLIGNAVQYTEDGGRVVVRLLERDDHAVLEVEDTGRGIPTRALDRVFERFYRVDVARSRSTGGTGLGLAIVKHVAEAHRGSVSVDSELGVGSTFRFVLPVAPTEAKEAGIVSAGEDE